MATHPFLRLSLSAFSPFLVSHPCFYLSASSNSFKFHPSAVDLYLKDDFFFNASNNSKAMENFILPLIFPQSNFISLNMEKELR